jgi:ubiquinone/menaquinone biosynthesis C-methylase UbiE
MAQASRFIQPEGYKQRVRNFFLKRAVTYDDDLKFHSKVAQKVVEAGHLEPGHVVLDVACGTGLVSLSAVELVGPSGRVVGIDISPQMVEKARLAQYHITRSCWQRRESEGRRPPFAGQG